MRALKTGIATVGAALAVATAPEAAQPATNGVYFSDNTYGGVTLGCQTNWWGLRGMRGSASTVGAAGQPTYFKLFVWDRVNGYQAIWGNWQPVYYDTVPLAIAIDFSGAWMERYVYVYYGRYVNGRWQSYADWLILRSGSLSCYL